MSLVVNGSSFDTLYSTLITGFQRFAQRQQWRVVDGTGEDTPVLLPFERRVKTNKHEEGVWEVHDDDGRTADRWWEILGKMSCGCFFDGEVGSITQIVRIIGSPCLAFISVVVEFDG